jgi:cytoskeletal protein RodZ
MSNSMDKSLRDTLRDEMQAKGTTPEKIARETAVPERYLTALLEGHIEKLPPAPYVRGYLLKIATMLNLDGNALWETFTAEAALKSSGPDDVLPKNRFVIERVSRNWYALGGIVLLLLLYLGFNANRLLGTSELTITSPSVETLVTTASTITLLGKVNPDAKLTIDGESVTADATTGRFEKEYPLRTGLNAITFEAKTLLGKTVTEIRQVIYQPQ